MSPLAGFLIFIVSITALVIVFLTKQFQKENIVKNFSIDKTANKIEKFYINAINV